MKTTETPTADAAEGSAPRRLLDGGGDAFERMLVEPSLNERIPRASLERLIRGLELPPDTLEPGSDPPAPPATDTTPTGAGSGVARRAARLRLGALGAVAIGVGLAGWRLASREDPPDPAPIVVEMPVSPPAPEQPEARGAAGAAALEISAPRAAAVTAPPRPVRESRARQRAQRPAPSASSVQAHGSDAEQRGLSAELRALESVQRALGDRQPSAAARALASYERRFEHGELALEAELLGVEVALASGDVERARARARAIASRPAAARYRQRLDALMRAADVSDHEHSVGANAGSGHIESAEVNR